MKDIAIGICVFNRQELIDRQIKYIHKELIGLDISYELIIYDDFSSVPIEVNNPPINVVLRRGSGNVGLIDARNAIIKIAGDEYKNIIFIDDDIFIYNMRDAVKKINSWLDDGFSCVTVPYINLPLEYRGKLSWFNYVFDMKGSSDEVVFFNGGSSAFRMDTFKKYGNLEGRYYMYLEEEDLAIRIYSGGGKIKCAINESFVSIHDQPAGKKSFERGVYLLSNRMLYHKKFVRSGLVKFILNTAYCVIYLIKKRNFHIIREALGRYKNQKDYFHYDEKLNIKFFSFVLRRYFNVGK